MRPGYAIWLAGVLSMVIAAVSATASDKHLSFRLGVTGTPFIGGDAGSGEGAPTYDDAFETGLGAGVEMAYHFNNRISLLSGLSYVWFDGRECEGITFSNRKVMPLYVGAQYHFRPRSVRWIPYARLDLGVAYLDSVDVSSGGLNSEYWDSSWVGMFAAGGGLEYRMDTLSIFLDIKFRYLGDPDSSMGSLSDADPSWTLPVTLVIGFNF